MTVEERFWSKVKKTRGCWKWVGSLSKLGYGKFTIKKVTYLAHRYSYALVSTIPEGLSLDHLCRNRSCVNPKHLEPVTIRENTLRGVGITAQNARKKKCNRGHEFTHKIWSTTAKTFGRACRKCLSENFARYKERHPERVRASSLKYTAKMRAIKQQLTKRFLDR